MPARITKKKNLQSSFSLQTFEMLNLNADVEQKDKRLKTLLLQI